MQCKLLLLLLGGSKLDPLSAQDLLLLLVVEKLARKIKSPISVVVVVVVIERRSSWSSSSSCYFVQAADKYFAPAAAAVVAKQSLTMHKSIAHTQLDRTTTISLLLLLLLAMKANKLAIANNSLLALFSSLGSRALQTHKLDSDCLLVRALKHSKAYRRRRRSVSPVFFHSACYLVRSL